MAMIPDNPLVGGTVLRRAAIASPNFVHNVSGWSINQDGTAEFQNAIIRALLISSSAQLQNMTLNPGPLLEYGSTGQSIAVFTVAGSNNWVAPVGLVGSLIDEVICIGAGGGGGGLDAGGAEGGGGGGASSVVKNVAVTIGNTYHPFVGTGGAAGATGSPGTASTFAGDAVTVTGNPGQGAPDPGGGAGGTVSTVPAGVASFAGGNGGNGNDQAARGGGGGGSAASDIQGGNPGFSSVGSPGAAGGATTPGFIINGGAGANGGAGGASAPAAGSSPGGGGGGGGTGAAAAGSAGANGMVVLIYRTNSAVSLINSMAVAAGTDPNTGTAYQAGITNVNPAFGNYVQLATGDINFNTASGAANFTPTNGSPVLIGSAGSDGGQYQILHRISLQTSTLTVNQTTFTQQLCTQFASFSIATGISYRISGQIMYTTAAAAGVPEFQLIGAGGLVLSLMRIDWHSHIQATPYTNGTMLHMTALASTYSDTAQGGAGVNRTVFFDGYITASTAGSVGLFAATSIATDTFTVNQGGTYWRVEPIY